MYEIPRTIPTIACGGPSSINEAFRRGAADYLCEPWTEDELTARVGRLLPKTAFKHASAGVVLRGTRLESNSGAVGLSREEAALLRILFREEGKRVSRIAVRRLLWPRLVCESRIVDETVSRLRGKLKALGISKSHMEIRSIRGFGYSLELFH